MTNYFYDNPLHAQTTRTEAFSSDGKKLTSITTYPQDYATGTTFLDNLITMHNIVPVEKVQMEKLADSTVHITGGSVTEYTTGGKGLVSDVYQLEKVAPVPLSGFKFSNAASGNLPVYPASFSYLKDSRYKLKASVTSYDQWDNPAEVSVPDGTKTCYIWGYSNQ